MTPPINKRIALDPTPKEDSISSLSPDEK